MKRLPLTLASLVFVCSPLVRAASLQIDPTTGDFTFWVSGGEDIVLGHSFGNDFAWWGPSVATTVNLATATFTATGSVSGAISDTVQLNLVKDTSGTIPATQIGIALGFGGVVLGETLSDLVITQTNDFQSDGTNLINFENFSDIVTSPLAANGAANQPLNAYLVPEPSSSVLWICATGWLALLRRRR